MSVTISDVAARAGVSKSTVSKVLNGWSTISEGTVERVRRAMEELHYVPNARAVSFARQSTKNIIYLTDLSKGEAYRNPHMFDIMCGIYAKLTGRSYTLTLVDTSSEAYPGERAITEIKRRSADGLIIHGSAINETLAALLIDQSIPHIVIGHPDFESRLCWVDTDHTLAGECAARHVLSCGYTDLLFIGGKKKDVISNQRLKGFRRELLQKGLHLKSERIGYTNGSRNHAKEVARTLITTLGTPQAIVCENSLLALGVSEALRSMGICVPEQTALLTFDTYPYSGIIEPHPTVVEIDVYDMGVQAGDMMIRKLEHPELLIQSFTTLPKLIQGETTRPAL